MDVSIKRKSREEEWKKWYHSRFELLTIDLVDRNLRQFLESRKPRSSGLHRKKAAKSTGYGYLCVRIKVQDQLLTSIKTEIILRPGSLLLRTRYASGSRV